MRDMEGGGSGSLKPVKKCMFMLMLLHTDGLGWPS